MRPKFSCSVQFSNTDTFKKIEKYQDMFSILPHAKDPIWTSHVCGFSLSAGSVIRGVIFLMRSLISSHGYKATLWDYQINKIQGWPIEMEHLRMQCLSTTKSILGQISLLTCAHFDVPASFMPRCSQRYQICLGPSCHQYLIDITDILFAFIACTKYFLHCMSNVNWAMAIFNLTLAWLGDHTIGRRHVMVSAGRHRER